MADSVFQPIKFDGVIGSVTPADATFLDAAANTQAVGNSSTLVATTAFVQNEIFSDSAEFAIRERMRRLFMVP